jgi:hypothetical protein
MSWSICNSKSSSKLREIIVARCLLLSPVQTVLAVYVTDLLSQRMSVPLRHTRFPTLMGVLHLKGSSPVAVAALGSSAQTCS